EAQPPGVLFLVERGPLQNAAPERFLVDGIRYLVASESRKARELAPAPVPHRLCKLPGEVRKVQERLAAPELLAHEQAGYGGIQERSAGDGAQRSFRCDRHEALADRAVAHVVMVLQEVYEARRRQFTARSPALLLAVMPGRLSLVCKSLGEAASQATVRIDGV